MLIRSTKSPHWFQRYAQFWTKVTAGDGVHSLTASCYKASCRVRSHVFHLQCRVSFAREFLKPEVVIRMQKMAENASKSVVTGNRVHKVETWSRLKPVVVSVAILRNSLKISANCVRKPVLVRKRRPACHFRCRFSDW